MEVLAEHGARGLTHRRVDEYAGLPTGSTSNLFRTRDALLEGILDHLIRSDFPEPAPLTPGSIEPADAVEILASLIEGWVAPEARALALARYELWLESSRRPHFSEVLRSRRAGILASTQTLLEAAGLPDAEARAVNLMVWVDGLLLDHILDPSVVRDGPTLRRLATLQLCPPAAKLHP